MAKLQQLCRHYQRGTCPFGSSCKYTHGPPSGSNAKGNKKKPCHFFTKFGRCDRGDQCSFAHDASKFRPNGLESKKMPCYAFARGQCRRGDACVFSHDSEDVSSVNAGPEKKATEQPSGPSPYACFILWRSKVGKSTRDIEKKPLGRNFPDFIQQALDLVGAVETMQEIITSLSNECGLARLGELLNANFASMTDEALRNVFNSQLLPFLRIITHDAVLSSSVLESRLGTLANYLYGFIGKRSVAVFAAALRGLADSDNFETDLEPCMIALSLVLEINQSAQVNDDLRTAAEAMIEVAEEYPLSGNALKYHRRMCLRLGLGEHIKAAKNEKRERPARSQPTFDLAVDQPGELSAYGPRHDNDFANIRDIQILPTMSEIEADRAEYLPRSDPSTWHMPGVSGLLDRQFRLLREDNVGPLRDAAKVELSRIQGRPSKVIEGHTGARTHSYRNVQLVDAEVDEQKGLLCVLQFTQPREVFGKTEPKRKLWWEESKRLESEALIMLLGSDQIATFLTVVASLPPPGTKAARKENDIRTRYSRSGTVHAGYVVVQLVNSTDTDIETMLFRFGMGGGQNHSTPSFSLLEFPGVLLPAFQHTLTALQQMSVSNDLPFVELLAPVADQRPGDEIDPPAYTRRRNFRFDLSALSPNGERMQLDVMSPMDASEVSPKTRLDNAQAEALISTLCRSMALIQGPPGTGKSYTGVALMKVLIANKSTANLGPILCVTFTNHALDQILEHLVDSGVEQIIRIGSRSKSERLSPLNLRVIAQREERTKLERTERWQFHGAVSKFKQLLNENLALLKNAMAESTVLSFLEENYPEYHNQLHESELDEDGFQLVKSKRTSTSVQSWLQGSRRPSLTPKPLADSSGSQLDLYSLKTADRQRLFAEWQDEITAPIKQSILSNLSAYHDAKAGLDQIRSEIDLRVLSKANVIGITTSGLARSLEMLRRLNSKVLLVEEAGEVLEAHMLTAMLPSIEQLILIGDHQQLRPKAQNYDLSCENPRSQIKMDISLFERLVSPMNDWNKAVPFVTLEIQRRMHPSISKLIRSTLYPNLKDSPQVASYPEVSGMRRRLFWLDHDHPEDGVKCRTDSTSHTNEYEVDMTVALVRHLLRQGTYGAEDIAVLTPYLGQLRKLRRALSEFGEIIVNDRDVEDLQRDLDDDPSANDYSILTPAAQNREPPRLGVHKSTLLQKIRLSTSDNFQGEESKVIVISLVQAWRWYAYPIRDPILCVPIKKIAVH